MQKPRGNIAKFVSVAWKNARWKRNELCKSPKGSCGITEARLRRGKRGCVQRWDTDEVHIVRKHQQNRCPGLATSFA